MKQKPILFSTPMVQAILEGKKTQTRRIVKFPKDFTGTVYNNGPYGLKYSSSLYGGTVQRLAYCLPDDILWVRETWVKAFIDDGSGVVTDKHGLRYWYKADDDWGEYEWQHEGKEGPQSMPLWKPSIFMPKDACRIFLKVKSVRVEKLHDISEEDAMAEGITLESQKFFKRAHIFGELWESINGKESWDANPWVWVIEFEKLTYPEK